MLILTVEEQPYTKMEINLIQLSLFVNFQIHRWVRNLLGSLMECAEALLFPYGCLLSCLKRERADFPGGPVAETELPMQVDWV